LVRSLESATNASEPALIAPLFSDTRIFITLGYRYQMVVALVTNSHLQKSTLTMLVYTFTSYKNTMNSYQQEMAEQYRFFSYGDAILLSRNLQAEQEVPSVQMPNRLQIVARHINVPSTYSSQ
jgi:S-adenosylmethionine:tRNA ribosyltransferase-isomerase